MRLLVIVAILVIIMVSGCTTAEITQKDLPSGDVGRGSALFKQSINGAPECSSCHTTDGSVLTGPSLQGFSSMGGTRVGDLSTKEYAFQSIMQPSAFIVSGYGNVMYNQYGQRLNAQQIADLIAYLLTL